MATQLSFLDYPEDPGFKARDTSRAAAEGMRQAAKPLRERVFDAIKASPATPEEVAKRLGVPLMNVRPRTTELSRAHRIEDSGKRRKASGGRQAIVWRACNG